MSLRDSKQVLEVMLDGMVRALRRSERVEVRGFGTLGTHERNSRTGRNPQTGAYVDIPARRVPHFRPSKELIELVNRSTIDADPSPILDSNLKGR